MTDVMKCGISSRKTTGRVIDVAYDHFYVAGNEVTPFSFPGDSGRRTGCCDGDNTPSTSEHVRHEGLTSVGG
jgi:hypothetical protein